MAHPGGRPSKYKPEIHLVIVKALSKRGLTLAQLSDTLDVTVSTLSKWISEYEEFSEAIKEARDIADEAVEASLYQRATGYNAKSVKIFMPSGAKEPVYAPFIEHFPPDPTSMIFWLKNRRPAKWRDKQEDQGDPSQPPMNIHINGKPNPEDLNPEKNDNIEITPAKNA